LVEAYLALGRPGVATDLARRYVGSVFRKRGLRSRTELARAIAAPDWGDLRPSESAFGSVAGWTGRGSLGSVPETVENGLFPE
jgi:hypothetical protein